MLRKLWQYRAFMPGREWEVQLADIRACMRTIIVGGLIVGICACGGGGGGSPDPVLGTGAGGTGTGSSNPTPGNLAFSTNENVALFWLRNRGRTEESSP